MDVVSGGRREWSAAHQARQFRVILSDMKYAAAAAGRQRVGGIVDRPSRSCRAAPAGPPSIGDSVCDVGSGASPLPVNATLGLGIGIRERSRQPG